MVQLMRAACTQGLASKTRWKATVWMLKSAVSGQW